MNVPGPRRTVSKLRNETYHVFSNLHPGTTYLFSVRARTGKGFGQTALTEITTNISGRFPHSTLAAGASPPLRCPRVVWSLWLSSMVLVAGSVLVAGCCHRMLLRVVAAVLGAPGQSPDWWVPVWGVWPAWRWWLVLSELSVCKRGINWALLISCAVLGDLCSCPWRHINCSKWAELSVNVSLGQSSSSWTPVAASDDLGTTRLCQA